MSAGLVRCSGRGIPVGVIAVSSGIGSMGSVVSCVISAMCCISVGLGGVGVQGMLQMRCSNATVRLNRSVTESEVGVVDAGWYMIGLDEAGEGWDDEEDIVGWVVGVGAGSKSLSLMNAVVVYP